LDFKIFHQFYILALSVYRIISHKPSLPFARVGIHGWGPWVQRCLDSSNDEYRGSHRNDHANMWIAWLLAISLERHLMPRNHRVEADLSAVKLSSEEFFLIFELVGYLDVVNSKDSSSM